jgi:6-phosphogluconate dehydrogenase
MTDSQHAQTCDIGLVGLGVMGRNFALNLADQGFTVAGYNRDPVKIDELVSAKAERHAIHTTTDIPALCALLRPPRAVMMLVPAGDPVDDVIQVLAPHLDEGDLIIDSGNSHFRDTDRRAERLAAKGLLFMGMGMSGGASGARHGPSLMPGGPREGYERVARILEAAAARADGRACVAYLGPGSAGHYVKMVHNGIEYGLMQLIAESYDLMKRGLGLSPAELHAVYNRWCQGPLEGYLMEITAEIFQRRDERSDDFLIDRILDQAKQKGTGEWTAAEALALEVPTLNIDTAVMLRHLSGDDGRRRTLAERGEGLHLAIAEEKAPFMDRLANALTIAVMVTYDQGMALLAKASEAYGYALDLETVIQLWRGGCIIRARMLAEIQTAYRAHPDLPSLLVWPAFSSLTDALGDDLRAVVRAAAASAIPVPGLSLALSYIDAYRGGWLPANLIMAQRDYFGSHTYQRVDAEGTFHTRWESPTRS